MFYPDRTGDDDIVTRVRENVPRRLPSVMPAIPIRGDTIYFPHMLFPLFLGREKSIRALDHALKKNRYLFLLTQKSVAIEDPTPDDVYKVGLVAEVMQVLQVPDGTVRVTLEGIARAKVAQFVKLEPFFSVRLRVLKSKPAKGLRAEALMRNVVSLFEQVVQNQIPSSNKPIPPELMVNVFSIEDPSILVDTIVPHLPLKSEIKQEMLETLDVEERLEKLNVLLEKEIEISNIQRNIRDRVEQEIGEMQREYILREQLKAIQQELGERDVRASEIEEYKARIKEAQMPEEVEERAMKELDRLEKMPYVAPDGVVIRTYLDWLISLPWNIATNDSLDLAKAAQILDQDHYGLTKVKERIIEFLAVRKLNSEMKGPILCFVGPPGVGKTSIGKSIARALGRKFYRLSLGGVRDEAEIRGHRRTYVGALPGRIIQGIKQAGTCNPVFMLDEIDKIGVDFRGDPSAALLEVLDPEQNSTFSDHYLEVPFNLRDVMFITTANVLDTIPPALRDRMEIISFSGYIEHEKMQIARKFLVPKQLKENGLNSQLLSLRDSAIRKLIREYTREAGVRELERCIGSICRKVGRDVAENGDRVLRRLKSESSVLPKINVCDKDVPNYLGPPKHSYGRIEDKDGIGIATGLVYTETGGDIVSVEVAIMQSERGKLILTGQLGDVMKESAQAALTYVRSRVRSNETLEGSLSNMDIHIHVPAGAVPKDGPSAGVTIAVALASAINRQPVRRDVAMTGEITLRGRVLPVGGIKEKILAAHRAGIRTVILPKENESDLEDIPEDVRREITLYLVTHADEVLEKALVPNV